MQTLVKFEWGKGDHCRKTSGEQFSVLNGIKGGGKLGWVDVHNS